MNTPINSSSYEIKNVLLNCIPDDDYKQLFEIPSCSCKIMNGRDADKWSFKK